MRVTKVNVTITAEIGKAVKGYASILFDNCFAVKNIRIIKRDKGYLVAMPSKKTGDEYDDVAYPINSKTREIIVDEVMNKFWTNILNTLDTIKLPDGYDLSYNTDDIHDLVLIRLADNKIIDKYIIDDYKTETLEELEEEIKEKLGSINE